MEKIKQYIKLALGWEKNVDKLGDKLSKSNFIDADLNSREFSDDIYGFLTDNNFDEQGFEFVWRSVKLAKPSVTKAKFFDKYIHQKFNGENINILDNIDNNATSKRVVKRLKRDLGALQGRIARLDSYSTNVTLERVNATISDVRRILNTNVTTERHIRTEINNKKRVLGRKSVDRATKGQVRQEIRELKSELLIVQRSNKKMSKSLSKFTHNYRNYDERKLDKEYNKILNMIKDDITKNQQRVVLQQTMRSSAMFQTKTVAQTQFVKEQTEKRNKELNKKQDGLADGEILLVKYSLNADHNIVDICDDFANADVGYGKGIYPLREAPQPVADTHPNCKCELEDYKVVEA